MLRQVMWSHEAVPGLEHCSLRSGDDGITADSIVIGVEENVAFRIRYEVKCDVTWHVREVAVSSLDDDEKTIRFTSDGSGHWTNAFGAAVPALTGCFDVDITVTPFTNTLPIRRLGLRSGESAVIRVVYLSIPDMQVSVEPQRYTCLTTSSVGGQYQFESLNGGFTAVLTVDAEGFVETYPTLFKRVWVR